jgi:hypothetical protein
MGQPGGPMGQRVPAGDSFADRSLRRSMGQCFSRLALERIRDIGF